MNSRSVQSPCWITLSITPLHREDILSLISRLRTTIEHITQLAERFSLYPVLANVISTTPSTWGSTKM